MDAPHPFDTHELETAGQLPDAWADHAEPAVRFSERGILLEGNYAHSDEPLSAAASLILSVQNNIARAESTRLPRLGHHTSLPDSFGSHEIPDELASAMETVLGRAIRAVDDAFETSPDEDPDPDRSLAQLLNSLAHSIDRLNQIASLSEISHDIRWGIRRTRDALIELFNESWLRTHYPEAPFTQHYRKARTQLDRDPDSLTNRLRTLLIVLDMKGNRFSERILGLGAQTINDVLRGRRGIGSKPLAALKTHLPPVWRYFLFEGGSLPLDPAFHDHIQARLATSLVSNPPRRYARSSGARPVAAIEAKRLQMRAQLRARCEADLTKMHHRLGLLWLEMNISQEDLGRLMGGIASPHISAMISGRKPLSDDRLQRLETVLTPAAYRYLLEGGELPAEGTILSGRTFEPVQLETFSGFSEERFGELQTLSGLELRAFTAKIRGILRAALPHDSRSAIQNFHFNLGRASTHRRLRHAFTPAAFAYMVGQSDTPPGPNEIFSN